MRWTRVDQRRAARGFLIAALVFVLSGCEGTGPGGPHDVVVHPSGDRVYVAGGKFTQSVWIVDAGTNQVVGHVSMDDPSRLAISPTGTVYAHVGAMNDIVFVIDTSRHEVVGRLEIETPGVNGIGLNGTGTRLYIAGVENVQVFDTQSHKLLGSIPGGATDVASAPWHDEAYVLDGFDAVVFIMRDAEKLAEIKLPTETADAMVVHPSGTRVYVTDFSQPRIFVIDPARRAVISTIVLPDDPGNLVIHPAATTLYMLTWKSTVDAVESTVDAVDLRTGGIRNSKRVGKQLRGIAIHPSGTHLYVSDNEEKVVYVLDASTLSTTAVIQP